MFQIPVSEWLSSRHIPPSLPPSRNKNFKLELTRLEPARITTAIDTDPIKKVQSSVAAKRIPTIQWVSRETKKLIEKFVVKEQICGLCECRTSKRRIHIHIRQDFCIHFCHCGFKNVIKDQVEKRQRTTRRAGHATERCQVHMITEEQYPEFCQCYTEIE